MRIAHYSIPQGGARIAAQRPTQPSRAGRPGTRELIHELLGQGLSVGETARRLEIAPALVSYHARKLGLPPSRKYAPRTDWPAIQTYYDAGHSLRECQERFGFSRRSWNKAVERGTIVPRPQGAPIEDLLVAGRRRQRSHVKSRVLKARLKANRCEDCGLDEWLGQPVSLALHHVNGDGKDNRLENLQLLCPNCHSQTPTFARHRSARQA
ncbi:MAG: HNH endonuclease [Thermoleophilaceae bacterium]